MAVAEVEACTCAVATLALSDSDGVTGLLAADGGFRAQGLSR
jgi:hypothetical protein